MSSASPIEQQAARAEAVGGSPGRVGGRRVERVHHHHDHRHVAEREPDVVCAQHQKRFAEPGQREHRAQQHDQPVTPRQAPGVAQGERRLAVPGRAGRGGSRT
jgi:hypothetical protein